MGLASLPSRTNVDQTICTPGSLVLGFYAGPRYKKTSGFQAPCPVSDLGMCWRALAMCSPHELRCWHVARVDATHVSDWELLVNWISGDPLYRLVPRALVRLMRADQSTPSLIGGGVACGSWFRYRAFVESGAGKPRAFQRWMRQTVAESAMAVRVKHTGVSSCTNRDICKPPRGNAVRELPQVTLHLSFTLNADHAKLIEHGRLIRLLSEASKIDACFEEVLVTADVPEPKDATHSRQVISSPLGRGILAQARQQLRQMLPKFNTRFRCQARARLKVLDYSSHKFLQVMAFALSHAFGLKSLQSARGDVNVPWLLSTIRRMFKSTPQQFYAYSLVQTELFLHQDGDRGFQFKHGSQLFHQAADAFLAIPRLFYIGLPPCPGLDVSQDTFHQHYLGGVRPFNDIGRNGIAENFDETMMGSHSLNLTQHWSEYGGHVFRQHVSMCGFVMNLTRLRELWPFQHWDRHIDLLHDANVQRFAWHPSAPGLAATFSLAVAEEACAVGEEAKW